MTQNRFNKFIIKIVILTLILIAISAILFATILSEYYFSAFPYLFILFLVVSSGVHYILLKASEKRAAKFPVDFMLSTMIRLLGYSIFVAVFLYFNKEIAKSFVVSFLSMYFVYTIFEVKLILSDIQKIEKDKSEE